jgi:hypothetical protein
MILQAADPRIYFDTEQDEIRSNAGALAIDNSLAGFPSWPTVTITLTGAGSQRVGLTRTHDSDAPKLVVDLTGIASGHVIEIDMDRHTITDNGTPAPQLYYSGDWWDLPADTCTVTVSNETGTLAGSVEVEWYRAIA